MNYALFYPFIVKNPTISEKEEFILKKLRQTLAIVLAIVMLVATIPFVSNAADKAITFSIATVNGNPYTSSTPIIKGDQITVDVKVSRGAADLLSNWVACFNFDSNALVYGGVTYPANWATYSKTSYIENGGYYQILSVTAEPVAQEVEVIATITFTTSATFTGTTYITTGMGSSYIGIKNPSTGKVERTNLVPSGCSVTVRNEVDKSALLAKLNEANALSEDNYTPNSWSTFAQWVAHAQGVYDNALAAQDEVDTALGYLTDAFAELQQRGNLKPLQDLVIQAKNALRDDQYTSESKQYVREAIGPAEDVLDLEENATQAQVDEQVALLTEAMGKLASSDLTVRFLNYDGTPFDTQTVPYGGNATKPATDPVQPSSDEFDYEFIGWDGIYTNVTSNIDITPIFKPVKRSYTITFYEEDGVTPITSFKKEYGYELTASDAPEAPAKPQDDYNTYEFDGWTPELATVTGDASYTAHYKPTARTYDIQFQNYNGDPLYTYHLGYGETVPDPVTAGDIETPVKPSTDEKTYTFTGWDPAIKAVDGPQVYTAKFSDETNKYSVKFYNWDGELLKEYSLDFGADVINPITAGDIETPQRANDEMYSYTFKGWTPELADTVTANLNYTADFDKEYLPAVYDAVDEQIAAAEALNPADYTPVSFARVTAAKDAVVRDYTIDKQNEVNAMASAIENAINALVSTTEYDKAWNKCAAITSNDDERYQPDSYSAFRAAMDAIGAKKDFNTEDATQAQVDAATKALDDAFNLLVTATLEIDGQIETIDRINSVRILANSNSETTTLFANDGGDGSTASLVYYDLNGNVVTNPKKSIGTGFKVDLVQGGQVKRTKYIVIFGDIDGDGQVTISDIALARKMAVSLDGFSDYAIAAAKCGGDTVDVNAVIALAKAI